MLDLRLLFVALVWGVNFAIVKFALGDFSPLSFTITRFLLAALFLFSVMLIRREPLGIVRNDRPAIIRLGIVGITFYNIFFMYGLRYTSASHSALFISLSPLFAVLIQAAYGRERLSGQVVGGIAFATAGTALIIGSHAGSLRFSSEGLIGDLLTLVASLLWALYTTASKPLLDRYSPIKVTAYCMATGSIALIPFGVYELVRQSWSAITPPSWAALAFSAIVPGGIAFSLWYQGVKRLGVTRTITYHYLVPFVAVIFAALFLGEAISLLSLVGGGAIITGVALVQRGRRP